MTVASEIRHCAHPRDIKPIRNFDVSKFEALEKIGININPRHIAAMSSQLGYEGAAMDAIQPTVTAASIEVPIQFLQTWLPGHVVILTAARKIDEAIGIDTIGSWEDEEIVQTVLELTGYAQPYGDYTNLPFASWNNNFNHFTVFRSEQGINVTNLEQLRTARVRIDTASVKRQSATLALEISRNLIGFFGVNAGANLTFGFLNTPGVSAYQTVPNGASGFPQWPTKATLEIFHDLQLAAALLQNQSLDNVDPQKTAITLFVPTSVAIYLTTSTDFGKTVRALITENFPNWRVVSAPQLNTANGGVGVFYLYAERIDDDYSTDGGKVWSQMVQTKFMIEGVEKKAKGYLEGYTNATAGVMCKRPFAVVRFSGIA